MNSDPRIVGYGDRALLIELAGLDEVLGLYEGLRHEWPVGVVDVVPAARTVLVAFDPVRTSAGEVERAVLAARYGDAAPRGAAVVEIPVSYDGADLAVVATATGLSEAEVVRRHRAGDYVVAFCGFAPGFAYLAGGDPRLRVPRRATPRTRVAAGSVGLAGEFCGIYPRESPGGWQLIGHTSAQLWSLDRDPPALLPPGSRVRFVAAP